MKALLEEFNREDTAASKAEGLDPRDWSEARQRAPENNGHLWTALLRATRRFPAASTQLQRMSELKSASAD